MTIEQIEKRLDDALINGTEADVNYWRGYRDAVKAMQKEEPNIPLMLEELRKMRGDPAWLQSKENRELGRWVIVREVDPDLGFVSFEDGVLVNLIESGDKLALYRRPLKEN